MHSESSLPLSSQLDCENHFFQINEIEKGLRAVYSSSVVQSVRLSCRVHWVELFSDIEIKKDFIFWSEGVLHV